jgi:AcrR family transcriptional regulator
MAEVAGERGYAATRVSDVLERSGASRRTFYAHFDNLADCFFAAHDAILADLARALDARPDEPGLELAFRRVLAHFSAWPAHARVLLIEVLSAGRPGVTRYEQSVALCAANLAECPSWQPGRCESFERSDLAQATVGAILRVIQLTLLTRGAEALPRLGPSLVALTTRVKLAA